MKIIADSHIPYLDEYFGAYGELIKKPGRLITAADVLEADVLLVRSITRVDRQLLEDSRVKFVGSVTAGADHLDTEWMEQVGIAWNVAVGFNSPPVADYVLSVVAALRRKQVLSTEGVNAAVIGVGSVGRLVAAQMKTLGMEVTLCDPIRAQNEPDFVSCDLQDLQDQDIIFIHVPLTKTGASPTYHFIDKDFLRRQKPGCVLVNASRGSVIHSADLLAFGTHLFWCFDVWEHEPKVDKKIVERAFIASPHIAGYSVQSKIRGTQMIYDLACTRGILSKQVISPIVMPTQKLTFASGDQGWEDVVLGAFNPIVMTAMMRSMLLSAEDDGVVFDDMRLQFNYRHEIAFTEIDAGCVAEKDLDFIHRVGVRLLS